jgi:hypothetical protein
VNVSERARAPLDVGALSKSIVSKVNETKQASAARFVSVGRSRRTSFACSDHWARVILIVLILVGLTEDSPCTGTPANLSITASELHLPKIA